MTGASVDPGIWVKGLWWRIKDQKRKRFRQNLVLDSFKFKTKKMRDAGGGGGARGRERAREPAQSSNSILTVSKLLQRLPGITKKMDDRRAWRT